MTKNILKFVRNIKKCYCLDCEQEGSVKIDLIDFDTLLPTRPKFFCPEHAPSNDDGTQPERNSGPSLNRK